MAREFLFEAGVPVAECHASSLARVDSGWRIVWFGGSHEKHPDVGIWSGFRADDGTIDAPVRIAKVADEAHWNPVVFAAPDGRLHLWFKVGISVPVWRTYTQTSDDGGATWSAARELVPGDIGGRGPVKNKPIVLSDGAWLAGASVEVLRPSGVKKDEDWDAFCDRSVDGGRTWERTDFAFRDRTRIAGCGVIQPTLWESSPGNVHMLIRSSCRRVCRSDSTDGGRTWSSIYPTDIPHNDSGIDVAQLADGTLVLCCNPIEGAWPDRSPLSLLVSRDNGLSWTRLCDLVDEPGCEFSYPSVIPDGPDGVALCYTWKRRRIVFQRVAIPR